MSTFARQRLAAERKHWRKDHPPLFVARPNVKADGSTDVFRWTCYVPGKKDTDWDGAYLKLSLIFPEDYPQNPPKCMFVPVLFHPNVYPSGTICLSILNAEKDWKPSLTIKQLLLGIQDLLSEPNQNDPAQEEPFQLLKRSKAEYSKRIRLEALKYPFPD